MMYLEEALEQFNELAPELVLTIDSDVVAEKITTLENKYKISLSSLIIYWAIGEVKINEFKNYLISELEVSQKLASEMEPEIIEQLIKPINDRLIFLDASPAKTNITMAQEKLIVLEILRNKLKAELTNHPIIINAINSRIFTILSVDYDFFRVMEKALYENQEKLTTDYIMVNNKSVAPTVANWLADFIAQNGTDNFSTIKLSQYITNSVNTKNLSNDDKENITRLLLLYRNLKFFPETFDEISEDKWEILPLRLADKNDTSADIVDSSASEIETEMSALELRALKESRGE